MPSLRFMINDFVTTVTVTSYATIMVTVHEIAANSDAVIDAATKAYLEQEFVFHSNIMVLQIPLQFFVFVNKFTITTGV